MCEDRSQTNPYLMDSPLPQEEKPWMMMKLQSLRNWKEKREYRSYKLSDYLVTLLYLWIYGSHEVKIICLIIYSLFYGINVCGTILYYNAVYIISVSLDVVYCITYDVYMTSHTYQHTLAIHCAFESSLSFSYLCLMLLW